MLYTLVMPSFIDRISEVGKKFNFLTLESEYRRSPPTLTTSRRYVLWKFRCICGNIVWSKYDSIARGEITNCGCKKNHGHKKEFRLSSKKRKFRSYQKDAKKRNLPFDLTFDQFIKLTSSNCFYCNSPPSNIQKADGNNGDYIYNGIDRINNDNGYMVKNCVTACTFCNNAKKHLLTQDFYELIEAIYKHRILKEKENE